jgi:hypothetical protein
LLLRGGDAALEGVEELVLGGSVELPLPHQPLVVLQQLLLILQAVVLGESIRPTRVVGR